MTVKRSPRRLLNASILSLQGRLCAARFLRLEELASYWEKPIYRVVSVCESECAD